MDQIGIMCEDILHEDTPDDEIREFMHQLATGLLVCLRYSSAGDNDVYARNARHMLHSMEEYMFPTAPTLN